MLIGVSASNLIIIYDTIYASGLTAQASGANLQVQSDGAVNCHATALPISIHGFDA